MSDQPQRRPAPISTDNEITAINLRRNFDHYDQRLRSVQAENQSLRDQLAALVSRVAALESA